MSDELSVVEALTDGDTGRAVLRVVVVHQPIHLCTHATSHHIKQGRAGQGSGTDQFGSFERLLVRFEVVQARLDRV
jgi:hypothetical protein